MIIAVTLQKEVQKGTQGHLIINIMLLKYHFQVLLLNPMQILRLVIIRMS